MSYETLFEKNPLPVDLKLLFKSDTHEYFYDGTKVPKSVTAVIGQHCPDFDAAVVCAKNRTLWTKEDPTKVYNTLFEYSHHVLGKTYEEFSEDVALLWKLRGQRSASSGTKMHAAFEDVLNYGMPSKKCGAFASELGAFEKWFASFCEKNNLKEFRTELCVADVWIAPKTGKLCGVAGSVDFVLAHEDGIEHGFWVVDYKRYNPDKALLGQERQYRPSYYKGPMRHIPATKTGKCVAQLNLYAELLERELGSPCLGLSILQVFPREGDPHWHQCVNVPRDAMLSDALLAYERDVQDREP